MECVIIADFRGLNSWIFTFYISVYIIRAMIKKGNMLDTSVVSEKDCTTPNTENNNKLLINFRHPEITIMRINIL